MILGMSGANFTMVHVILSLIGMVSGLIVLFGMVAGKRLGAWTAIFFATTILTSATGFPIPPLGFDPPRVIGILSLVLLALAALGFYVFRLAGAWRKIYVVTMVTALYLNCFVGVVQAFQKVPFLHPLAPTQSAPAFVIAQLAVLVLFILLGFLAAGRFHPKRGSVGYSLP